MKEMRRSDRKMEEREAQELLRKGEYGFLASVDSNGQPYATPLNYFYDGNCIYLHGALTGTKLENIKQNPKVCFTIVGATHVLADKFSTKYESVMAIGLASEVIGEEKRKPLEGLIEKYSKVFWTEGMAYIDRALDKTMVIKILVTGLTGKERK